MRRRRTLVALGLVATLGLALSACSIPTDSEAHALPSGQDPLNVLNTAPTDSEPPATSTQTVTFMIFYIHGGILFPVRRSFHKPDSSIEALNYALDLLAIGPTGPEIHNGITTGFSPLENTPPVVTAYNPTNGLADVALDQSFSIISGTPLAQAMGQIVYTLTSVHGVRVTGVLFTENGIAIDGYSPLGRLIPPPVTRADYIDIVSGVQPAL
jgi:spore germination protein GerM